MHVDSIYVIFLYCYFCRRCRHQLVMRTWWRLVDIYLESLVIWLLVILDQGEFELTALCVYNL